MDTRSCILVVDDDPAVCDLLAEFLSELGYRVHIAQNGIEGLMVIEREQIDLILLDNIMPAMDGCTFLQQYQALAVSPVPVVLMTAGRTTGLRRYPGVHCVLTKPFLLEDLE